MTITRKIELSRIIDPYCFEDCEDPRYYDQKTGYPIALLPNAPKEALEAFERMKEIWAEEKRTRIMKD